MIDLLDNLKQIKETYEIKFHELLKRMEDIIPILQTTYDRYCTVIYELLWNEGSFAKEVFEYLYQEFGFHEFKEKTEDIAKALEFLAYIKNRYKPYLIGEKGLEELIRYSEQVLNDLRELIRSVNLIITSVDDAKIKIHELETRYSELTSNGEDGE